MRSRSNGVQRLAEVHNSSKETAGRDATCSLVPMQECELLALLRVAVNGEHCNFHLWALEMREGTNVCPWHGHAGKARRWPPLGGRLQKAHIYLRLAGLGVQHDSEERPPMPSVAREACGTERRGRVRMPAFTRSSELCRHQQCCREVDRPCGISEIFLHENSGFHLD